ncbi:MAG: shikimate kinase [Spirochaetales bacterium]|nr:shikimate kinase [Spirochaetales bacterium]
MKTNISLIGMPGAGKSTIGIILAKNLGFGFLDSDILIQINQQKTLQEIIDEKGHLNLRSVEEGEILKINLERCIISTGGSAVYSEKAMEHLKGISHVVFLDVTLENLEKRIGNFSTRGIAKEENQTFSELFEERNRLYRKYADLTVDANQLGQDQLAGEIARMLKGLI